MKMLIAGVCLVAFGCAQPMTVNGTCKAHEQYALDLDDCYDFDFADEVMQCQSDILAEMYTCSPDRCEKR